MELEWQPVPESYLPPVFEGYNVYYAKENESLQKSANGTTKDLFATVYGLESGVNYRFEVAAVSNGRKGPSSNTLQVQTRISKLLGFLFHILDPGITLMSL